jgi:hypothetical protein
MGLEAYLQFLEEYWSLFPFPEEPATKKEYSLIFL